MKHNIPRNLFPLLLIFTLTNQVAGQEFTGPDWKRHTIDASSQGADGIRLADVNLDGLQDLATGWEEGGAIHVCLNPGAESAKQEWPRVTVGAVNSPEDAVFADLDENGVADVVSSCEGDNRTLFFHWAPRNRRGYLQSKNWTTTALPASSRLQRWMFCLPGHVDNKNGVDLVVGGKGPGASVGWFESPRNPKQLDRWKWHPISPVGWLMSLQALDMDQDGDLDIVLTDRRGVPNSTEVGKPVKFRGCRWLENPGSYSQQVGRWKSHLIGGAEDEVMFMKVVDYDQNGLWDFFIATKGQEILYLKGLPGSPARWQTIRIPLPPSAGTAKAVQIADINLDRQVDLIVTCENAKNKTGVFWMNMELNPSGTIGKLTPYNVSGSREGIKYDLVEALDLDGDGDLDLLTCEERDNLGVIWYENPTR